MANTDGLASSANKKPTWAKWFTRVMLVFAICALVYTINDIGLATIGRYFSRIGWWWIAVIALEVFGTFLDAVAIRAFMSHFLPLEWKSFTEGPDAEIDWKAATVEAEPAEPRTGTRG